MSRTFVLASAYEPEAAARAAAGAPRRPDLCVISPSETARRTSGFAVGGAWTFTVEEPLLASRAHGESGADVLGRLARALRIVQGFDAKAPLIVCDGLDILGAGALALDEEGLMRLADDLEGAIPLP